MLNPFSIARRLRQIGLVGIGQRNADFVLRYNQRKYYPRVDDKLITKALAIEAGLPVPELYAVVREEHEIAELHEKIRDREQFVVKPAHGSGGDGILVVTGRRGEKYRRSNGALMGREEFEHHLSNMLSGLFSPAGNPTTSWSSTASSSIRSSTTSATRACRTSASSASSAIP